MKVKIVANGPSTRGPASARAAALIDWLAELPPRAEISIANNAGATFQAIWEEDR